MISGMEIIIRLVLSAVMGGLIGIEREVNNRPAGLRTHVLVTVGSALIMLISIDGFSDAVNRSGDPARLAAQVVSGIGFLGAGTIMRTGTNINGLTTAASLWVSAGLGLAIGSGYYMGAIVTGIIVMITLMTLGSLEKKVLTKNYRVIDVLVTDKPGIIGQIGTVMGIHKVSIRDISVSSNGEDAQQIEARFMVKTTPSFVVNSFYRDIYDIDGVVNVVCSDQ